jgi:predicted nucleic acid-binding Zn ribbon protein
MPLYDLGCECGYADTDVKMSVSEYTSAKCPMCGNGIKSVKFPTSFKLKGGGWTPTMTGPERKRTRAEVLGEANYEYKKMKREKKSPGKRVYV